MSSLLPQTRPNYATTGGDITARFGYSIYARAIAVYYTGVYINIIYYFITLSRAFTVSHGREDLEFNLILFNFPNSETYK